MFLRKAFSHFFYSLYLLVLFNIIADLKYRSHSTGQGVQLTAPSINYQTTHIPLDLIEHFVTKRLGLGDTFNGIHLSVSWRPVL